jgi:hypothetical protein
MYILLLAEVDDHPCIYRQQLLKSAQVLLELSPNRLDQRAEKLIAFGRSCMISGAKIWKMSSQEACKIFFSTKIARYLDRKSDRLGQKRECLVFALEQIVSIEAELNNKLSILNEGVGTEKAIILRSLVTMLSAKKQRLSSVSHGTCCQKIPKPSEYLLAIQARRIPCHIFE